MTQGQQTSNIRVKLLCSSAVVPKRHSDQAAGYDLTSVEDAVIDGHSCTLVNIGIAVAVPHGTYGRIAPRSGISLMSVHVGAGVIDADYRGPVKVLLYNLTPNVITFDKGTRVAQLVLEKIAMTDVEVVEELDGTCRGDGGFGSTGFQ